MLTAFLLAAALGADPLPMPADLPRPPGNVTPPGAAYEPPLATVTPPAGAPRIFECSRDAGPDQTVVLTGERLSADFVAWTDAESPAGKRWDLKASLVTPTYAMVTIPDGANDGPILLWPRNEAGVGLPVRLNVPEPWWCQLTRVGGKIACLRLFGRALAQRPDSATAHVWLAQGDRGRWLRPDAQGSFALTLVDGPDLDLGLAPGDYQVWVHAGIGGVFGWGRPVPLHVPPLPPVAKMVHVDAGADVQAAIDAQTGAAQLRLHAGVYHLRGSLRVPTHVSVTGDGPGATVLQLDHAASTRFAVVGGGQWNQGPGAIHSVGDVMGYELDVPADGTYAVWLRYATDMAPWNQPGVSDNHSLQVDDGPAVPLANLPNTGSFSTFRWSKSAELKLTHGRHRLTWRNDKGGGINLDAYAFSSDPAFTPADAPFPATSGNTLVLQAENVTRFETKEGQLPGTSRCVVWLAGEGAEISSVTLSGTPQTNCGVLVQSPTPNTWLDDCRVSAVTVTALDGKQGENMGVHLVFARRAEVTLCRLQARAPIFLSGLRQSEISGNELVSVTRFGGNAEAAILGRNEALEGNVIERNTVVCPDGAEAGGPTARRLIWVSTGRGSVTHNWLADNGVSRPDAPGARVGAGQARFGGVAGTDQNVGEMILFEGNHRTMYFGAPAAADAQSITLPKTLTATPDDRLGSVKRTELSHDAAGNETPFWPPDSFDATPEPPIGEYYVSIFSGPGQGQTRRVLRREGERLFLTQPWAVPPTAQSRVTVGTAFYQNHIVSNRCPDGMTGVQLWIACVENVISRNTIVRQRKPGIFLYANGTTLGSSMPRTWNRGLSPLFFNLVEGNRVEECSDGALVTSGEDGLPVEFPRALGNVLRFNSFLRSRFAGVVISAGSHAGDTSAAVVGTVVEYNVVRDAQVGYHVAGGGDGVVLRRNHAWFWYPTGFPSDKPEPCVGLQIDPAKAVVYLHDNEVEGRTGESDSIVVPLKRAGEVSKDSVR